jgi:hypothetical protein
VAAGEIETLPHEDVFAHVIFDITTDTSPVALFTREVCPNVRVKGVDSEELAGKEVLEAVTVMVCSIYIVKVVVAVSDPFDAVTVKVVKSRPTVGVPLTVPEEGLMFIPVGSGGEILKVGVEVNPEALNVGSENSAEPVDPLNDCPFVATTLGPPLANAMELAPLTPKRVAKRVTKTVQTVNFFTS